MNQLNTDSDISRIIEDLEKEFPFEGYMSYQYAPYQTIYDVVSEHLQTGQRLFDFGSGPCDKTAIAQSLGIQCTACDDFSDAWYLRDDNLQKIKRFASSQGIEVIEQLPDLSLIHI